MLIIFYFSTQRSIPRRASQYESEENMTLPTQDEMIDWLKQKHDIEYKIEIQELYKTTSIQVNKNTTNPKVNLNKT